MALTSWPHLASFGFIWLHLNSASFSLRCFGLTSFGLVWAWPLACRRSPSGALPLDLRGFFGPWGWFVGSRVLEVAV